jgi:rubrerythrin
MAFADDIKDEQAGHEHYLALAKKYPQFSKRFTAMARDELRHKGYLEEMAKASRRGTSDGYMTS